METGSDSHYIAPVDKHGKRPLNPSQLAKDMVDMATMDEAELKELQKSLKKRQAQQADIPKEDSTDYQKRS